MTDPTVPNPSVGLTPAPTSVPGPIGGQGRVTQNEENPLDWLGRNLFGENDPATPFQHSALGSVPVLGALGREIGGPAGTIAGAALSFGGEVGGVIENTLNAVPLGWADGADGRFDDLGDELRGRGDKADLYAEWLDVQEAAKDVLRGGNLKSDFTKKVRDQEADESFEGTGFMKPSVFEPSGSLGGVLAGAINNIFALPRAGQYALGQQTVFGSEDQTDMEWLGINAKNAHLGPLGPLLTVLEQATLPDRVTRVQAVLDRAEKGLPLNPAEEKVVEKLTAGEWSENHALDYLLSENQGVTRELFGQVVADVVTDPATYLTLGSGLALKAGAKGAYALAKVGAEGVSGLSAIDRGMVMVYNIQKAPILGEVFKVARFTYDPWGALRPGSSNTKHALLGIGEATAASPRIYGAPAWISAYKRASAMGIIEAVQEAEGLSAGNRLRQWLINGYRDTQMSHLGGEVMNAGENPNQVIKSLRGNKSQMGRVSDYGFRVRKLYVGAVGEKENLVNRMHGAFGDVADWATEVAKMSPEEMSFWHSLTHSASEKSLFGKLGMVDRSVYKGALPLDDMVLLNDEILDNVAAQNLVTKMKAAFKGPKKVKGKAAPPDTRLTDQVALWNENAKRYQAVSEIGHATENQVDLDNLVKELEDNIQKNRYHGRAMPNELAEEGLEEVADELARLNARGDTWHIGFQPAGKDVWGLYRNPQGVLKMAGQVSIRHATDLPPGVLPTSVVARNRLGQIIGDAPASLLAKPLESIEMAARVAGDSISGQRLVQNMEQRFIKSGFQSLGLTRGQSRDVWRSVRNTAQLQATTVQGINPNEFMWKSIRESLPADLARNINEHDLMVAILDASSGDLRIMGLTAGLTQRARTSMAAHALGTHNYMGQATVTLYRTLRYSLNPTFYIQKVTDSAYFNILKGVHPVGNKPFKKGSELERWSKLVDRLGETATARDFAMDMPEYQFNSILQDGIRASLTRRASRVEKIGAEWQQQNLLANSASHQGDIVAEAIEEARASIRKLADDPTLSAAERMEYELALDQADTFEDVISHYNILHPGLDRRQAGLRYIEEQFTDARASARIGADGTLDWPRHIVTGEYHIPTTLGDIRGVDLPGMAQTLGYRNIQELRYAVGPEGDKSIRWLKEVLKNKYHADPGYISRTVSAVTFDWDEFWTKAITNMGLEPGQSRILQNIVAQEAVIRQMEPSEYLSQVLKMNLGDVTTESHFTQLMALVKSTNIGSEKKQLESLAGIFLGTVDLSGQRTLRNHMLTQLDDLIAAGDPTGSLTAARAKFLGETEIISPDVDIKTAEQLEDAFEAGHQAEAGARPNGTPVGGTDPLTHEYGGYGIPSDAPGVVGSDPAGAFVDPKPGTVTFTSQRAVSEAFATLPTEQLDPLVSTLGRNIEEFPLNQRTGISIGNTSSPAVDFVADETYGMGVSETAAGMSVTSSQGRTHIFLSDEFFGPDGTRRFSQWKQTSQDFRKQTRGKFGTTTGGSLGGRKARKSASPRIDPDTGRVSDAFLAKHGPEVLDDGVYRPVGVDGSFLDEVQVGPPGSRNPAYDDPTLEFGAPFIANDTLEGTALHESAHGVDALMTEYVDEAFKNDDLIKRLWPDKKVRTKMLKDRGRLVREGKLPPDQPVESFWQSAWEDRVREYEDFVERYSVGEGRHNLSEYSHDNDHEAMAELFSVTFDPNFDRSTLHPASRAAVEEYQTLLEKLGVYKPIKTVTTTSRSPHARDAFADLISRRMKGEAISNPDVEALAQHFSRWLQEVLVDSLPEGRHWVGKLADEISGKVPIHNAYYANRTEQLTRNLIQQKVELAQRDAFRLAEMQTSRTVLERSLNHPLFGIYPASYMWGKVLPELATFIAKSPFGFETSFGALLYLKLQADMAGRREWDPEFEDAAGALERSPTHFLLDYMTPSLPWSDLHVGTSPAAQVMAEKGFNPGQMTEAQLGTISPLRWTKFFAQSATEIFDTIGTLGEPPDRQYVNPLEGMQPPPAAPGVAAPTTSTPSSVTGPLLGTELAPVLLDEQAELELFLQQFNQ